LIPHGLVLRVRGIVLKMQQRGRLVRKQAKKHSLPHHLCPSVEGLIPLHLGGSIPRSPGGFKEYTWREGTLAFYSMIQGVLNTMDAGDGKMTILIRCCKFYT